MDYINKVIVHTIVDEENRMTTYRVMSDSEHPATAAGDAGIYSAFCHAARDVWPFLTTGAPGSYTVEDIVRKKDVLLKPREGAILPVYMAKIRVECGTFACELKLVNEWQCGTSACDPNLVCVWRFNHLFSILAQFANFAGVRKDQRPVFVEGNAGKGKLLARFSFDADKMIPKMKACCSKDNPLLHSQQPAIDIKRGVMVATDGRILAIHKLSGFRVETLDDDAVMEAIKNKPDNLCFFVPRDIAGMKGRIRVDVVAATWKSELGHMIDGLCIEAVDSDSRRAETKQSTHYPNYKGVVWCKQGATVPVDRRLMASVKQVSSGLTKKVWDEDKVIVMDAPRGSDTMLLTRKNNDEGTRSQSSAQLPGKSGGLLLGVKSDCLLAALAFEPTSMCCFGPGNQMAFISDSTRVIVMPMLIKGYTPLGDTSCRDGDYFDVTAGSTSYYKLPANDFEEWLSGGACGSDSQAPVKVKVKVKKPKPAASPVAVTATQTVADRFRARLRSAMGIAV